MAASPGEHRQKVLDFDRRLRMPWTVGTPLSRLDELEQSLKELKESIKTQDPWGRQYLADAERMLSQLHEFARGDWVTIDLSDPLTGFDMSVIVPHDSRPRGSIDRPYQQGMARLMAPFVPPLLVEAQTAPLDFAEGRTTSTISWRVDKPTGGDTEPHHASWGASLTLDPFQPKPPPRERYSLRLSDTKGGLFWDDRVTSPGAPHWLQLRLWNDAFEGRLDDVSEFMEFREPLAHPDAYLAIEGFTRPALKPDSPAEPWQGIFTQLRVRRLSIDRPPPEKSTIEQQEAYWKDRLAKDPDDDHAMWELCRVRLEQLQFDEVLKLVAVLEQRPHVHRGTAGLKGQALFAMKRYAEAKAPLVAAEQESGYIDGGSLAALAEICAAAPDESLRDLENAGQFAANATIARNAKLPAVEATARAAEAVVAAARGNFDFALKSNKTAIERSQGTQKEDYERRQTLYEQKQAFVLPE
jgi:hypothetical protein